MTYTDPGDVQGNHKIVVVLKAKLEPGTAINAAAHLTLGLTAKAYTERPELVPALSFLNFADADGGVHAPISALSLVVLSGKDSHLRRFRDEAIEAKLLFTDFTSAMTGDTYAEQLERSAATAAGDLEYYGVAAFGTRDEIDPLTRRFSLWR